MAQRLVENTRSYVAKCHACQSPFDAAASSWCDCDSSVRTLICPQCGSCFCSAPAAVKRQFWAGAPHELREDPRRFAAEVAAPIVPDRPSVSAAGDQPAPLVLVVDDDEAIRSLVCCMLHQLGYRTISADNPYLGLQMARSKEVRVVVTDALMPGMDGREMCKRIKESHPPGAKSVIVMTSLYTSRRYRTEAFKAFLADDYLVKPVQYDALASALRRAAPLPGSVDPAPAQVTDVQFS